MAPIRNGLEMLSLNDVNFDGSISLINVISIVLSISVFSSLLIIWACACCKKQKSADGCATGPGYQPVCHPTEDHQRIPNPRNTVANMDPRYKTLRASDSFTASKLSEPSETRRRKSHRPRVKVVEAASIRSNSAPTVPNDGQPVAPDKEAAAEMLKQYMEKQKSMAPEENASEKAQKLRQQRERDKLWRVKHHRMLELKRPPKSPQEEPTPLQPSPPESVLQGEWKVAKTVRPPESPNTSIRKSAAATLYVQTPEPGENSSAGTFTGDSQDPFVPVAPSQAKEPRHKEKRKTTSPSPADVRSLARPQASLARPQASLATSPDVKRQQPPPPPAAEVRSRIL